MALAASASIHALHIKTVTNYTISRLPNYSILSSDLRRLHHYLFIYLPGHQRVHPELQVGIEAHPVAQARVRILCDAGNQLGHGPRVRLTHFLDYFGEAQRPLMVG